MHCALCGDTRPRPERNAPRMGHGGSWRFGWRHGAWEMGVGGAAGAALAWRLARRFYICVPDYDPTTTSLDLLENQKRVLYCLIVQQEFTGNTADLA